MYVETVDVGESAGSKLEKNTNDATKFTHLWDYKAIGPVVVVIGVEASLGVNTMTSSQEVGKSWV